MMPCSIVCFKWKPQQRGYRSTFGPAAVNALHRMVARHYRHPHRFICVTDDSRGLESGIDIVPLWEDFATIPSPHGGHNPSCYRRLKAFAPEMASILGERFVWIDLDTVVVGDLIPLFDRREDFVIWGETNTRSFYNGSMVMMTAGARRQVLEQFDPQKSPQIAKRAGRFGSDQGWISYALGPGEATWGRADGVYSYRVHIYPQGNRLPADARIVMFHGKHDPWDVRTNQVPWVRQHWGVAA